MTTQKNTNTLPPGLVSNLQQVLLSRKPPSGGDEEDNLAQPDSNLSKPIILVTNSDGVHSPGLSCLVDALVRAGAYNVFVVAPQSDKTMAGHSLSPDTVEVASVEVNGAVAFEISGTPADCISLALSGALFSWSKPLLVISGVNKGSNCGHNMFYSGVVAGAREGLFNGIPSISISLNWLRDESSECHFKDAVAACLPIIAATIRDIGNGIFPKGFLLDIEVPNLPLSNKGIKITKKSLWRSTLCWQANSGARNQSASRFLGAQAGMGLQFAQLSLDASAVGAARRLTTQKKDVEVVESVGAAGNSEFKRTVKYYRAEIVDTEHEEQDEDLDCVALRNGFVSVTPVYSSVHVDSETETAVLNWISSAILAAR